MMKSQRNLIWLVASAVLFVNCTREDNNAGGTKVVPVDDGGTYTETMVTVNNNGSRTATAVLRFYSGKDGIPYISISDFHKVMLPQGAMSVNRQGDLYQITTSGGTAMVDVKADQLTTSSIISVFDMISLIRTDIPCAVSYDGSQFMKPVSRDLLPEVSTVTFNFKKYDIDIFDDGQNVYFPYATLADIYSDMNINVTYYNDAGKELLVNHMLDFNSFDKMDPGRVEHIYGRQEVTDYMAQFRYHELCFVFDYIYGYPGRDNDLFRAGMEQCGFDEALDKVQSGAEVKKLLKSKDNAEFLVGMNALQRLAYDGGHTTTTQANTYGAIPAVKARVDATAAKYPGAETLFNAFVDDQVEKKDYIAKMKALRNEAYGDKKYIVSSDKSTAVIVLNSFMDLDDQGWKDWYNSQKTDADWNKLLARDGNLLATFLNGVRQARKDGVKNVVLDLTQNSGGSSDLVIAILSLITRNESERQQFLLQSDYVISRQGSVTHYVVDRNFDGKFDEADALVDYSDLNFSVLTSKRSFSCANLMPALMKDDGFKVIGERSGGGACAIQCQFTPDGMMYIISCYRLRMLNGKRESIDAGVPIDIEVPIDKFYDIDYLAGKF